MDGKTIMNGKDIMNRLASCLLLGILLAGCGGSGKGPAGTVAGKVTFQGAPLAEGNITFVKVGGGGSGAGVIETDGTYSATGVEGGMPTGDYVAVLVPPEVTIDRGPNTSPEKAFKEMKTIPGKYRSDVTSDLKVTIREGRNDFNIDMK